MLSRRDSFLAYRTVSYLPFAAHNTGPQNIDKPSACDRVGAHFSQQGNIYPSRFSWLGYGSYGFGLAVETGAAQNPILAAAATNTGNLYRGVIEEGLSLPKVSVRAAGIDLRRVSTRRRLGPGSFHHFT